MRLKGESNQHKDILYLVIAIVLAAGLIAYLFWFLHDLVAKTNSVFSPPEQTLKPPTFDFARYDKLMQKISNTSTTAPAAPAVTTTPASSSN